MQALNIAWKDLRHTYRNVAGLAMMLIAPLVLATALGAAFGGAGNFTIPQVKTVVVDLDSASAGSGSSGTAGAPGVAAGSHIVEALTGPDLSGLLAVTIVDTEDAARAAVDGGEAGVAVIIPAGLSAALTSPTGQAAQVVVYKDPGIVIGPAIVTSVVQSVADSMNGSRAAALTSVQLASSVGFTDAVGLTALATRAAEAFSAAQAQPLVSVQTRAPVIPGAEAHKDPNVASQVLVGMMIFFMLFGAATPARSILDEHRLGTLSRLFTTPTPRSVILGGKYISVYAVVLTQSVILLLAGRLFFGAHWGEIGPVVILTLCGALVAASLALLMVSFAKTPGQAGAVSAAIFVFLGLVGGNFVGTLNVGGVFRLVRRFTPNGWLLEGWERLLYGGSWGDIAAPVAAVLGFSLVFFALATFFFRRRYS